MKKRVATLLLALFMLSASLAACAGNKDDGKTTTPSAETTAPQETTADNIPKDELPDDLDYNGAEIGVFMQNDFIQEMIGEVENDIVSTAVNKRNEFVQERLHIKFHAYDNGLVGGEPYAGTFMKQILAGDTSFQLLHGGQYFHCMYQHRGLFYNLKEAPYLDYDKPWWTTMQNEAAQVRADLIYTLCSDATYSVLGSLACVFMNKKIITDTVTDIGPDGIYNLVLEGHWTMDKLNEYSRLTAKDLDGNSVMDIDDQYGCLCVNYKPMYIGTGGILSSRDEYGEPYLTLSLPKNMDVVDVLGEYFSHKEYVISPNNMDSFGEQEDLLTMFTSNKIAFMIDSIMCSYVHLRAMESEYGILPIPKLDESQGNYISRVALQNSAVSVNAALDEESMEMCCAIMEAMASASYRIVTPAYYEKALKAKYVNDSVSAKVIDLIHDTATSDFADMYGDRVDNPIERIADQISSNSPLSSAVAKIASTSEKTLEKYLKKFEKMS